MLNVPKTFREALLLAAEQQAQIEQQEQEIKMLTPKAEFYDTVTSSKDCIDIAECAKVLNMGIGRNNLFEILRGKSVLNAKNIPYQKYVDAGYFRLVEVSYNRPDGEHCINFKTLVLQKGVDFIRRIIKQIN